jgi:Leucine-rich repeat (LRR) protein
MKKKFVLFLIFLNYLFFSLSQDKNGIFTLEEALKVSPELVLKLNLKKQKLAQVPFEITQFKNLTHLDLSFNKLSELPAFISDLKQLEELNFSKNKFTIFPSEICNLTKLKSLKFNRNSIEKIDSCISNLRNLQLIDFWDNPMKEFSDAFLELENLKEIHAEGIRYNQKFHDKWKEKLPKVKIFFGAPCDCMD